MKAILAIIILVPALAHALVFDISVPVESDFNAEKFVANMASAGVRMTGKNRNGTFSHTHRTLTVTLCTTPDDKMVPPPYQIGYDYTTLVSTTAAVSRGFDIP